jgi:pimeloyl-ACP methyl ester carboxylesterase
MPLLARVGEQDILDFRKITGFVCRRLPQARKLIVPGVGHMANMEAPNLETQALPGFLTLRNGNGLMSSILR